MWLLDTNVISEMMETEPNVAVAQFIDQIYLEGMTLAAISVFEILKGISLLDPGKRRQDLTDRFYVLLNRLFKDRIYGWTEEHAKVCVQIMEAKRRRGESLDDHLPDAMIASTAKIHGLTVVTRNEKDFSNTGVNTINPWLKMPY